MEENMNVGDDKELIGYADSKDMESQEFSPGSRRKILREDPCAIANHAQTRRFRSILRDVRKLRDWMVDGAVSCEPVSALKIP
jgi:hypothetical protein